METVILTEGMTRQVFSGAILKEIFGEDLSKKIKEANPDFLKNIDEKILIKIEDFKKNKIRNKPRLVSEVNLTSNSFNKP